MALYNIAENYDNIELYKKLMAEKNATTVYDLLGHAVKNMKAKEFLDFSKKLESVITAKQYWGNLLLEIDDPRGPLPRDKEISGEGHATSDYHKNVARVARLAEGADYSDFDKSRGYNPDLEYASAGAVSMGKTSMVRSKSDGYKSGVVNVDKKILAKELLKKKLLEKQNS